MRSTSCTNTNLTFFHCRYCLPLLTGEDIRDQQSRFALTGLLFPVIWYFPLESFTLWSFRSEFEANCFLLAYFLLPFLARIFSHIFLDSPYTLQFPDNIVPLGPLSTTILPLTLNGVMGSCTAHHFGVLQRAPLSFDRPATTCFPLLVARAEPPSPRPAFL